MRGRRTKEQLQDSFDFMLSRILAGGSFLTGSGLDEETMNALEAVAMARPDVPDNLVEAARRAFAGQLDGSNAARWRAERDRVLTGREEQSKRSRLTNSDDKPDKGLIPARDDENRRRYRNELLAEGNRLNELYRRFGATPEGSEAFSKAGELRKRYMEWLPEVPVARSPFTDELTTWPIDTVDLDGWFWNWANPIRRRKSVVPADWLAMGGAMRLVEPLTPLPFDFCMPGPDVPYVVPRLLNLPETRAVLSQVVIGHHTGWTITYFTTRRPHRFPLENLWGSQEYDIYDDSGHWRAWSEHPQDLAEYSFDLRPWLEAGKLLWVAPGDPAAALRSGAADCPYLDLPGHRRMQMISEGTVRLWGRTD
ncbi:hypothetical protein [Nocardia sp. JMUB6875]|uniref:hypothetical protein n=1 Tax=Nocardia sp. JMUB6875 TaxID=3158170 RepID=UPI0034E87F11